MDPLEREKRERIDLLDYAWSDLRLDGSALTREGVASIIHGELVRNVSIAESSEVRCHERAMHTFKGLLYMQIDIDRASLQQIAGSWEDFFDTGFRRGSPVLPHLGFTPPYHGDVAKLLDELFRYAQSAYGAGETERKAARVHNGLVYIYPFTEHSEMIARAAMQYTLLREGKPVIDLGLSEREYNQMVADAIRTGDDIPLARAIELAVKRKEIAFELTDDDGSLSRQ
ncbi:MAG: Fic family protein [Clostridiales Family XIII bacterium]|jgi:Fic family protein|nr:Fic family protein [Clostridiales Family XIII bacterium]